MSSNPDTSVAPGYALAPDRPWEDLDKRVRMVPRSLSLEIAVRMACKVPGNFIEFGVADGSSTRQIKRILDRNRGGPLNLYPRKEIFACDSFEGLPEAYENAGVGAFAQPVPDLPGVNIVKGYFDDTCTPELAKRVGRVAFAHLDADLYSSTMTALTWLTPLLGTGSLLLFDEFVGGELAEAKAFDDWRKQTGTECIRIAEFDREPSAWGSNLDRRLLYQVVKDEPIPAYAWDLRHRIGKKLGLTDR